MRYVDILDIFLRNMVLAFTLLQHLSSRTCELLGTCARELDLDVAMDVEIEDAMVAEGPGEACGPGNNGGGDDLNPFVEGDIDVNMEVADPNKKRGASEVLKKPSFGCASGNSSPSCEQYIGICNSPAPISTSKSL